MKVYVLSREDASHLGGPMGTEYTIPIGKPEVFKTIQEAYAAVKKINDKYNKNAKWDFPTFAEFKKEIIKTNEWSSDLRCEIVSINVKNI